MKNGIITKLPTKTGFGKNQNKEIVDWNNTIGISVSAYYKNELYNNINILSYDKKVQKLKVSYNNKETLIDTSSFLNGSLGYVLGLMNRNYLYKVDEIIKTKNGEIKVLKQLKDNKNQKAYLMECEVCSYLDNSLFTYEVSEYNLKQGKGCPCCSKQKLIPEINSVYVTNPEYNICFKNIEDAKNTTISSAKKIVFKCPICGEEKIDCMNNISYNGFSCKKCSDGVSYPNKFAFKMLEELRVEFINEYSPDWIGLKRYDFYFKVDNKEYILEMDGGLGHGKRTHSKDSKTKEESVTIDNYKDKLANEHSIKIIRIDCDYGHNDRFVYVKQNILCNDELNEMFDLSQIDWLKCHEFACSSRIKEACNLWNSGIKNAKEISKIMKMDYSVILDYLKQGAILNFCDYSVEKALDARNKNNSQKLKKTFCKPVKCLNNNQIFESATAVEKQSQDLFGIKISRRQVAKICRREKNDFKGFKFIYV